MNTVPAARPPGPRELPVVGSALRLMRHPLDMLVALAREHGDVARFSLPGQRIFLVSHPDLIETALQQHTAHLIKDKMTREVSVIAGNGLLTSEGTFWRRQRLLAQPAFHHKRVQAYGDAMVQYAQRLADQWHSGQTFDVHREMTRLTLEVVAKTLFGIENPQLAQEIGWASNVFVSRFQGLGIYVPTYIPTPANLEFKRALRRLDEIIYEIVRTRRAEGDTGDLISMLIAATSDEEGQMTDRQLRDEAVTLLLAGHETTALTLTFAWYLLGRHPDVADRLAEEARTVLGDRAATAADLPRLRYADAVVRETMRLYPPAWGIGREATASFQLGDYMVPAGTQLWFSQWVVHRDARWFANPERFDPSRWDGDLAKKLPRYAYFPFGGGARICIGNAFAMMEAVLMLVTLVRRWHLVPTDARPPKLLPAITLRPLHGIPMRVEARGAAAT